MRKPFTLLLLFVLPLLAQQAQAPVEITSEPHHHQVLDNMFVRVFAVSIDPGASTLMHHHGHNYLGISIGDAQFTNNKEGAQPVAVTFKDGDTRYTPAGLNHAITNTASTPFRNVTIELLGPTTNEKTCTDSCSVPVECSSADKSKCVSVTKLITADQWTVTQVTVPAGAISAAYAPGEFPCGSAHRCSTGHEEPGQIQDHCAFKDWRGHLEQSSGAFDYQYGKDYGEIYRA